MDYFYFCCLLTAFIFVVAVFRDAILRTTSIRFSKKKKKNCTLRNVTLPKAFSYSLTEYLLNDFKYGYGYLLFLSLIFLYKRSFDDQMNLC